MPPNRTHLLSFLLTVSLASALRGQTADDAAKLSFNFQVRPILAAKCYACHGPDEKKREAKLRLDVREAAIAKEAIKPGDAEGSELVKRIFSTDPDEVMPPPDARHQLSAEDKDVLRRWIAQGADYEKHWAFIAPVRPPVPRVSADSEIDAFVLEKLHAQNLQPAAPASREHWLRRVTFDLTGLPPRLDEIDAFLGDTSPVAFERVVDALLQRPSFGERIASDWLDAARYSDTYGRHEDADSAVWPYRDWVIGAFNANMPYDQFITWQTAGDLLPLSTRDSIVATAFNRLVQQSNEAGSNEEEFRQEHVADRVKTNATAILGLTMECARCHDHKFDPLTSRDYYSMAAFLNNIDELGLYARLTAAVPAPSMLMMKPEAEKRSGELRAQIAEAEKELAALRAAPPPAALKEWIEEKGSPPAAKPLARYEFENVAEKKKSLRKIFTNTINGTMGEGKAKGSIEPADGPRGLALALDHDNAITFADVGARWRRSDTFSFSLWLKPMQSQERAVLLHRSRGGLDAASRGYEIMLNDLHLEFALSHFAPGNSIRVRALEKLPLNEWSHVVLTYNGSSRAGGLTIYKDGALLSTEIKEDSLQRDILYRKEWGDFDEQKLQDNTAANVNLTFGQRRNDKTITRAAVDEFQIFEQTLTQAEARAIFDEMKAWKEDKARSGIGRWWHGVWACDPEIKASNWSDAWLRDHDVRGKALLAKLHALRTELDDLANDADEVMVMRESATRRKTFVQMRGRFDQPGEEVAPAMPATILPWPDDFPRDRAGLARWYVDRRNPLTARVFVNRVWQMFFGRGIVGTSEDFGIQGELPTHPELLDWLAVDFMERGWDVKRLCRMIALSATYRQSSAVSEGQADPQNLLLSRGPRQRLSAEMVRDQALAAGGLLSQTMGGAPAHPWQPEGLYEDSGIQVSYRQDQGEALWRRAVYTYWKRTMPPPALSVFDAPTREYCRVRREQTSTPLQALALMNHPDFMSSCRVLAEKLVAEFPNDANARFAKAFRVLTTRAASADEIAVLFRLFEAERAHFLSNTTEATALLQNGGIPMNNALPPAEVAATTLALRVLLSHDECQVKQ